MEDKEYIQISVDGTPCLLEHPTSIPVNCWQDDMKLWPRVEGPQIVHYLVKSKACDLKDANAFRSLQSYNYLQSGWVGQLLYYKLPQDMCYMTGEVTPSQNLSEKILHKPWVCVKQEGEVLSGGCTCMAGAGKVCSHVGAILWKIDLANRLGLTGYSSTDVESQWNKGTKRNLEPKEVRKLDFKKPKLAIAKTGDSDGSQNLEKPVQYYSHDDFVKDLQSSKFSSLLNIQGTHLYSITNVQINTPPVASFKHDRDSPKDIEQHNHEGDFSCPPCLSFYDRYVDLSGAARLHLNENTKQQSTSEIWKSARLIRITASIANKVPKRPTTDPSNFLLTKLYKPFRGNAATKHGVVHEKIALRQFEDISSMEVKACGLFVSPEEPWLGASPDGLIGDDTILEIKCPVTETLDDALKRCDVINKDGELYLNPKGQRGFYPQIQITMHCSKRTKCILFVWLPKEDPANCMYLQIEYDFNFVTELITKLKDFYFKAMLPKIADDYQAGLLTIDEDYKKICKL